MTISLDGNVGISLSGNISAAGNITSNANITGNTVTAFNLTVANAVTANLFVGTFQGNISGNLVVPGSNTQVIFNENGNAGASINLTFDAGNSILAVGGNIDAVGDISTTGNITGNYILGNGSQLTGLPATYNDGNVEALLASGNITTDILTTGNVSATGNITGTYIQGNGALLTGINSALQGNMVGNIDANTYYINNLPEVVVTGNITTSGGYVLGNAFYMTGLPNVGGGGNAYITNGSSNILIPTSGGNAQFIVGGVNAGNIGPSSVSFGVNAGRTTQGANSVAIGANAAQSAQGANSVAIGAFALGSGTQGANSVAIGSNAAVNGQGANAIAIGASSGISTANAAVAIGVGSGTNIGQSSIAIGNSAQAPTPAAISIGLQAGQVSQGSTALAIGYQAGANLQGSISLAVGYQAGTFTQGAAAVAVGRQAGSYNQGTQSVAIGYLAGTGTSGNTSNAQGTQSVAIGFSAGKAEQGNSAVAVGNAAGQTSQGDNAIAIGTGAGNATQGTFAVAIGAQSGVTGQGTEAVAIGYQAGFTGQGANSIALGGYAGAAGQPANSIVINASGAAFTGTNAGLYINPVRYDPGNVSYASYFNPTSNEVTYAPAANAVVAGFSKYTSNVALTGLAANSVIVLNTQEAQYGNTITYDTTSGNLTLLAGSTYRLRGYPGVTGNASISGATMVTQWFNVTANAWVGSPGTAVAVTATQLNGVSMGTAEYIFTANANTTFTYSVLTTTNSSTLGDGTPGTVTAGFPWIDVQVIAGFAPLTGLNSINVVGNITGGNLIANTSVISPSILANSVYSNSASASFTSGSAAQSAVALYIQPPAGGTIPANQAIRDMSVANTTIYFDAGMGAANTGHSFQFRSSNSFTNLATINSSGISTPGSITQNNSNAPGANTAIRVNSASPSTTVGGTTALDNLNVRLQNPSGGNIYPQISAITGSFACYTTGIVNKAGSALISFTNSAGQTVNAGSWSNVGGFGTSFIASGGDYVEFYVTDTSNNRVYRVTCVHGSATNDGSTTVERIA